MTLPLLKCLSYNFRLLATYPSFKIHLPYTLNMFSNHRLTVFFPFCCFVNLFKTFPVLSNYWYFLCYFLHPIITFFWSKDLVLLVFQVISGKANCLTCERCSLNMWRIRLQQHTSFEISLNSWKVAFVSYFVSPTSSTPPWQLKTCLLNCWGKYLKFLFGSCILASRKNQQVDLIVRILSVIFSH